MLVVGIPGPALDADTHVALRALRPGAVALFRRNGRRARTAAGPGRGAASPALRPLVAIDHEGGRVTRLGPPFTAFPAAAVLARAGRAATRAVGEAIGRELASVGIDVDFAPVLDVGSDREAGALGDRLFGNDPSTVAEMALAFAAGLAAAGVLPCGQALSRLRRVGARRSRRPPGGGGDAHPTAGPRPRALPRGRRLPLLMTAHVRRPA
ncbi:MAG: glycoside hydrolase family 3 N-terminal domain-containing protein [Candidatus Binatia bacterium]